ncbi:hypothetical protein HPG69_011994 [Diceros bicornis minor]|uniref:Uncharacterized protein n=1 Tax=Diceros bicornis minor TaxID=77932 RepID=A0A7J7EE43_DICBM|nr:hypothetical protein HPG69_011994 [Diceros bicornis minor]
MEGAGPPQSGPGLPGKGARGHLDLSSPEPAQDTEGPGLALLLGTLATVTAPTANTSKVWWQQPDPRDHLRALGPEPMGTSRVGPEVPLLLSSCQQKAAT